MFAPAETKTFNTFIKGLRLFTKDELESFKRKIKEDDLPQLEEKLEEMLKVVHEMLLLMEEAHPELKQYGSYADIASVEAMLVDTASGAIHQQFSKITESMREIDPNFQPQLTEDQRELQKSLEKTAEIYNRAKERIQGAHDIVEVLDGLLAEKRLATSKTGQFMLKSYLHSQQEKEEQTTSTTREPPKPDFMFKPGFLL